MIKVTAVAKISPKGQVVIPAEIRRALNVREGDKVIFQVTSDGRVELSALPTFTPESVIGILPYHGDMPSFEELRRKAREEMVEKRLKKGMMNDDTT
ncbi:MAG: AbrB/MazE/SpoVT family DNA-binding domain-containing protein [Alicyclobacillus shizuokensis]|nr:AbrB/MazE/SpoVT family DNA-binding domain-containing protein [Alicyclobacillus shizuokensis]